MWRDQKPTLGVSPLTSTLFLRQSLSLKLELTLAGLTARESQDPWLQDYRHTLLHSAFCMGSRIPNSSFHARVAHSARTEQITSFVSAPFGNDTALGYW